MNPSARNVSNRNFVLTLISWIFNPHSEAILVRFADIHKMYLNNFNAMKHCKVITKIC